MSSAKVDVDVYNGRSRLERLSARPVRLMPSNRAGVVYGGEVYPLKPGNRIDLTDPPVKKTLCSRFVPASASIPYAPDGDRRTEDVGAGIRLDRWYLESNRFGHYLVFDASLPTAKKVVAAMETADLGVRRWDESVRASDNGESYDWFIRLEYEGSREECLKRVRAAIGEGGTSPGGSATPADSSAASAELRSLRLKVLELEVENTSLRADALLERLNADAQIRRLKAEVDAAKKATAKAKLQLTKVRESLQADRDQLRGQISELECRLTEVLPRNADAASRSRLHDVLRAKEEAERQYFAAQEAAEKWEDRAHQLEQDVAFANLQAEGATEEAEQVKQRLDQANAELEESRNEARERRAAAQASGGPPQGSVEAFLSRLLPRTDLDADTIETLLDWPSPGPTIDFLRKIDAREDPRGTKAVVGKKGWREVPKVNTGRRGNETAGRIYFAPAKEKRVFVVLREKDEAKDQKRFIENLPDMY